MYCFFSSKKTVTIKLHLSENLEFQNLLKKEKTVLLKSLEISWTLTTNLKESSYYISADSFSKNKIAYDFRVEIISKCISKKLLSDIMDFSVVANLFL